jgi:hypothetical protein
MPFAVSEEQWSNKEPWISPSWQPKAHSSSIGSFALLDLKRFCFAGFLY